MTDSILGGTDLHFLETAFMAGGIRPVAPVWTETMKHYLPRFTVRFIECRASGPPQSVRLVAHR